MDAKRKNDFSQGSIAKNILSLAIPLTVAQLTVVLYNVVDRAFIGHIGQVGRDAFTGIGLVMPVTYIITAFANLCGTGGAPLCSIARGRGDDKKAARILGVSFTFLLLLGAGLVLGVFLLLAAAFSGGWLDAGALESRKLMGYIGAWLGMLGGGVVLGIWNLYFLLKPSEPGENRYGVPVPFPAERKG